MANGWIIGAATGGFAGVALGAAGAHLTSGEAHATALVETASRYMILHSLALLGVASLGRGGAAPLLKAAGLLFAAGLTLFGGGLALFATTGWPVAEASTPVGGSLLLLGWLCLGLYGLSARSG